MALALQVQRLKEEVSVCKQAEKQREAGRAATPPNKDAGLLDEDDW